MKDRYRFFRRLMLSSTITFCAIAAVGFTLVSKQPASMPAEPGLAHEKAAREQPRAVADNYALLFDNDDFVEVPNNDGRFNLVNAWTVEAWVKPMASASSFDWRPIVWKVAENGTNRDTFALMWQTKDNAEFPERFVAKLERAADDFDFKVSSNRRAMPFTWPTWIADWSLVRS